MRQHFSHTDPPPYTSHPPSNTADVDERDIPPLLRGVQWFSLCVEAEYCASLQQPGSGVVVWRLIVNPPLVLENQLPVPADATVWERTSVCLWCWCVCGVGVFVVDVLYGYICCICVL